MSGRQRHCHELELNHGGLPYDTMYFVIQSISRRALLLLPALGASTTAYARFVEPTWLELTERSCTIPGLKQPIDLFHLSDFHASADVPRSLIERAIEMAAGANPSLICITGDFITQPSGFDSGWYTTVLSRLAARAPTFAVLGNHDGGLWSAAAGGFATTAEVGRMVESAGIHLLANRSLKIACGGAALQIVGVGDLWSGELHANTAFSGAAADCPTILLSHNPDTKVLLGDYPWRLMLSGHTHGGQVVVPMVGFNPAPVWDRRYVAGLKRWRDRWIHVSRGVGNLHGIRFNCRPEVTRLRLLPPDKPNPA